MSGLAAARRLADGGMDVTVLEARDRIGGRTWTDTSLGMPIDLGGAWIHGTENNPLVELADQVGARRVETDFDKPVLFRDGSEVSSDDVQADLEALAGNRQESLRRSAGTPADDESVANGLAQVADLNDPLIAVGVPQRDRRRVCRRSR